MRGNSTQLKEPPVGFSPNSMLATRATDGPQVAYLNRKSEIGKAELDWSQQPTNVGTRPPKTYNCQEVLIREKLPLQLYKLDAPRTAIQMAPRHKEIGPDIYISN